MRGTLRRVCAAGLVIGALVTGLAACTADAGGDKAPKASEARRTDRAVPKACADGTFTWSRLTERDRLTDVSDPERPGKGEGALQSPMRRVSTPSPSVRAFGGPVPSAAEVLFSLGKKAGVIDSEARTLAEAGGDTWSFTDVRQPAPKPDNERLVPHAADEFVQYAGVREISADFRYTCPDGRTVSGHARNWTVSITGLLDCDERPDSSLARQAVRQACDPS